MKRKEEKKSEVKWIEEEMTVRGLRREEEGILKRREESKEGRRRGNLREEVRGR